METVVDFPPGVRTLPLYAYRCTQCDHKFEKIQNFSAQPELECPKCKGLLERPLTAPGLSFKGAGWYVNDYAGKSSAKAGTAAETAAPAAEAACPSAAACPASGACAAASSAASTS
jgi:putative FmdB family regulatory protein